MQDCDLVDVVPKNEKFTWDNRRLGKNNIMERQDRILVNVTLLSTYSAAYAFIHPFTASDHYPTSLVLETHYPLGPLPFKYNPLWNENTTAKEIIQHTWHQHIEGSPGYIQEIKIKRVKYALKVWAKNCYTKPEKEKRETKAKLENLHSTIEKRGFQQEDKYHEDKLYGQLYRINREEEQKWRIKSRQLWLKGGDKNSAFFHKQTTVWKIKNIITSIIDSEGNQQTS